MEVTDAVSTVDRVLRCVCLRGVSADGGGITLVIAYRLHGRRVRRGSTVGSLVLAPSGER